jgi:hypothetical protein
MRNEQPAEFPYDFEEDDNIEDIFYNGGKGVIQGILN